MFDLLCLLADWARQGCSVCDAHWFVQCSEGRLSQSNVRFGMEKRLCPKHPLIVKFQSGL